MLPVKCAWCDYVISGPTGGREGFFLAATCKDCFRHFAESDVFVGPPPPRDDGEDDVWRDNGGEG